jgi:hypothetical protein
MLKTALDFFKTYWGYFMTVVAAVSFIFALGVKSEAKRKDAEAKQKIDSILIVVDDVQKNQLEIINIVNNMSKSYSTFLANNNAITKSEMIELLKGITIIAPTSPNKTESTKKENINPELKVKITQVKK